MSKKTSMTDCAWLPKELEPIMKAWVAALADRFRNPLAGLRASVGIVQDRIGKIEKDFFIDNQGDMQVCREALQRSRHTIEVLDDLFGDLRMYVQPMTFEPRQEPAAGLLAECVREIAKGPYGRSLEGVVISNEATAIYTDKKLFAFACKALVHNALEAVPFTRGGDIRVRVMPGFDDRGRSGTGLFVDDNGVGFARALIPRATEPFVSSKDAGLGLGLAICQRIAEIHEGFLSIKVKEPEGSCVSMFFPDGGVEQGVS